MSAKKKIVEHQIDDVVEQTDDLLTIDDEIEPVVEMKLETVVGPIRQKQIVQIKEQPKDAVGIVYNCGFLNVRKNPSSKGEIINLLKSGYEVDVDLSGSTDRYYRITIKGVEGFCLKEFIYLKSVEGSNV
jgi:hypothetical protein